MKTNKFFLGLCFAAGMFAFSSCSNDEPDMNGGENLPENGEGVYMALTLQMPSANGGRSQTVEPGQSTDGNEIGSDEENAVDNVLIVLAKSTDNGFITAGTVLSNKLTPIVADNSYKTVAKIDKTRLNTYYNQAGFSSDVNVFVFCNPTADLTSAIASAPLGDTQWLDLTCSVIEGTNATNTGIWADNGFLMSNFEIATRQLPATMEDWSSYKTEATAFDLSGVNAAGQASEVDNSATKNRGAVKVQRDVARFDFKDESPLGDNTYAVVMGKDDNGDSQALINIQLNRIALANMSNLFYYVPRVSSNGLATGATICGAETRTNYVVGPYATQFAVGVTTGFSTYFNFPFYGNDGSYNNNGWDAALISDVLNGRDDLYEGTGTNGTHNPGDYKVWRYVTENVIPGTPSNQKKGITTTVVFKGKMVATDFATNSTDKYTAEMAAYMNNTNGKLTGNPATDPILYSFNGTIYFTWENVQKAAIEASVQMKDGVPETDKDGNLVNINRSNSLYLAVYGNGGMGTFTWGDEGTEYTDSKEVDVTCANSAWTAWHADVNNGEALAAMRKAMVNANFTLYQSSDDSEDGPGYYCYYYYYNRHNNNGDNGVMGAMEFGVVRNNVYKLAVTKISQLGHPRIPENDPDSPDPDDPDESDDIYITVTCRVLPWVVRINNIEF